MHLDIIQWRWWSSNTFLARCSIALHVVHSICSLLLCVHLAVFNVLHVCLIKCNEVNWKLHKNVRCKSVREWQENKHEHSQHMLQSGKIRQIDCVCVFLLSFYVGAPRKCCLHIIHNFASDWSEAWYFPIAFRIVKLVVDFCLSHLWFKLAF